jgi:hypothetical protein
MVDFLDDFPDAEILDALGDTVIYTPQGGIPITVKGFFGNDVFDDSSKTEHRKDIGLLKANFSALPRTGDGIEYKGDFFTLDVHIREDDAYRYWSLKDVSTAVVPGVFSRIVDPLGNGIVDQFGNRLGGVF